MKLFEFTRYNPLDDEVQQELYFAPDMDGAFEELYGYPLQANDPKRTYWEVREIPVKKGKVNLTIY